MAHEKGTAVRFSDVHGIGPATKRLAGVAALEKAREAASGTAAQHRSSTSDEAEAMAPRPAVVAFFAAAAAAMAHNERTAAASRFAAEKKGRRKTPQRVRGDCLETGNCFLVYDDRRPAQEDLC